MHLILMVPEGDLTAQGTRRRWAGKFPWCVNETFRPVDVFCSSEGVIFPPL